MSFRANNKPEGILAWLRQQDRRFQQRRDLSPKWEHLTAPRVLHTQDLAKLRDLLSHSNPDTFMPLNAPSLVSQAVILTLVNA
ncbi:hypothetical protein NMY22_g19165 [Coprinellus aureogranulatus]|nr:hypothetical protein NMY22_g19165 [Coprinellus aureogranulatus]